MVLTAFNQIAERIRAACLMNSSGSLAPRNAQHLDLQIAFFQDVDRALCRRLTGSVRVIRDDNAVGMPRDNARLLLGQRGANDATAESIRLIAAR